MHLPWSRSPEEEFLAPDGQWYSIFRAVVFDSWMLWKDALPPELELRALLDQESYDGITSLARKMHALHHRLPDYRCLSKSPFNVTAWWDPENTDPEWNTGRSCLFTIDGYTSKEFISYLPDRTNLKLRAVTSHFIEAYVPPDIKPQDQEVASTHT